MNECSNRSTASWSPRWFAKLSKFMKFDLWETQIIHKSCSFWKHFVIFFICLFVQFISNIKRSKICHFLSVATLQMEQSNISWRMLKNIQQNVIESLIVDCLILRATTCVMPFACLFASDKDKSKANITEISLIFFCNQRFIETV